MSDISTDLSPGDIQAMFETQSGEFHFARWGRPIVPMVLGVNDETLAVVKGGIEAVVSMAGHQMAETDPEMGANLMMFFLRDWSDLSDVPDIAHLVPEMATLLPRLQKQDASQYRLFRFEKDGAIRAVFVFLRMQGGLADMAAEDLALEQAVRIILLWGEQAFSQQSPLATLTGVGVIRPEIAALIRAAYSPILPNSANDSGLALRLFARLGER